MKKLLLIAAFILLLSMQIVSAQDQPLPPDGPVQVQIGDPDAPLQTTAGPTYEEQVLQIVNQERWNNGQLPPLKGNNLLDTAAETHSVNMAVRNFFAHCDLDTKKSPWVRMQDAGYAYNSASENIAAGQSSPQLAMADWMKSTKGHRETILSISYREIGIGYFYQGDDQANIRRDTTDDCNANSANSGPYRHYWTQNFGTRSSVYPVVINREAYETETRQVNLYMYGSDWLATEMRFRNEDGAWSNWQSYSANRTWTLSAGNGVKTVNAEIRNSSGTVRSASDTIILNGAGPALSVSPGAMAFALQHDGPLSQTHALTIQNTGQEPFNWTLTESAAWLTTSTASGTVPAQSSTTVNVMVSRNGLSPAARTTTLTIDAGGADNSPQIVNVTFLLTNQPPVFLPMITK